MESPAIQWPPGLQKYDYVLDITFVATEPSTIDLKGMASGAQVVLHSRILPVFITWPDAISNDPHQANLPSRGTHRISLLKYRQGIAYQNESPVEEIDFIDPDVSLADDGIQSGGTIFFLHMANAHLLGSPPPEGTTQGSYINEIHNDEPLMLASGMDVTGLQESARLFHSVDSGSILSVAAVEAFQACTREIIILI